MFKVYSKCCNQCLFSKNKIVSEERKKNIIQECLANDTHFICHKATISDGQDICCKGFYRRFKAKISKLQVFEHLKLIQWVKQPK